MDAGLFLYCILPSVIFTPPPVGGRGIVFGRFLSLSLCQQHYEKTAGQICIKFSRKVWSDHGTTWLNFGSIRVNGSAGQRSICLLSLALTSQYHSLGGSRGRGLLCLAPQLVVSCIDWIINTVDDEYILHIMLTQCFVAVGWMKEGHPTCETYYCNNSWKFTCWYQPNLGSVKWPIKQESHAIAKRPCDAAGIKFGRSVLSAVCFGYADILYKCHPLFLKAN